MFVCKHCAGHFEGEAVIDANGNEFCCNGCMSVYNFLNSHNLVEFYDKLGNQKHFKAPNLIQIDSEAFYKNYVKLPKNKNFGAEILKNICLL